MNKTDIAAIVSLTFDTIEQWSGGKCIGDPPEHNTKCTNQSSQDTYCECLADAANHCAAAHDKNWWPFTACMFEHNGKGAAGAGGLESDDSFEKTVKACAEKLQSYSFADLKSCYTGSEGFGDIYTSAHASSKAGAEHPVWMYVDGKLVTTDNDNAAALFPPKPDTDKWAKDVLAAICAAYKGDKPASCQSSSVVV